MNYRSQKNFKSIISIFAAVVILGAMDSGNIVLSKIMQAFPDVPGATVRLIGTLPSVTTMILTLIIGSLIGKKISYRTTCITGLLLIILGGTGPVLYHSSMTALLIMRAFYGVGLGLLGCRNGYLVLLCEGKARENVLSTVQLVQSVSALILPILCGWLGDIHWTYAFLPFLIGIIPLVMFIIYLKEPETNATAEVVEETKIPKKKEKASPWSWVYYILSFTFGLAGLTWITGMSSVLAERGIESSVMVSFAMVACQIGGTVAGILFQYLNRFSQKYTISFAALVSAIGAILMVFADTIVLAIIAGLFAGLGYLIAVISCNTYSALSTSRSTVTSVTTKVLAFQAIATFLTGFYIEICGNTVTIAPTFTSAAFLVSAFLQFAIFVISLIVNLGPREPK